jgi:translation initiation factor 2B subunit (eIF-2B alpha/beta/delta family)
VATLSRSGTVLAALRAVDAPVLVGESRPAREGVGVAEALAGDRSVTLATDAALPWLVADRDADCVLVGADAVLADGSVVNKAGTRALALAAAREGVPTYAVAAAAKVRPDAAMCGEEGAPEAVYDGDAAVAVANPTFDRTPADLVTAVVTEDGPLDADGVADVAAAHRAAAGWDDGGGT